MVKNRENRAIFDEKTVLYENWVQGNKFVVNDMTIIDIRGNYDLTVDTNTYKWKIEGEITTPKSEITDANSKKINSYYSIICLYSSYYWLKN